MEKAGDILGAFFWGSGATFLVFIYSSPDTMYTNGAITVMFGVGSIFAAITAWWIDFKKEVVEPTQHEINRP